MSSIPTAVRRLKAGLRHNLSVSGPELAAHTLRTGLVDELQLMLSLWSWAAEKRFFPDGVRLNLELIDEHRFQRTASERGMMLRFHPSTRNERMPGTPEIDGTRPAQCER